MSIKAHFSVTLAKRALADALNRKGMIVGLPKVTMDASQFAVLLRYVEDREARLSAARAEIDRLRKRVAALEGAPDPLGEALNSGDGRDRP